MILATPAASSTSPTFDFTYQPRHGTTNPDGTPARKPITIAAHEVNLPGYGDISWKPGTPNFTVDGAFSDAVKAAASVAVSGATRHPGASLGGSSVIRATADGAWQISYLKSIERDPASGWYLSPPLDGGSFSMFLGSRPTITTADDSVTAVIGVSGMMAMSDGVAGTYERIPRELQGGPNPRRSSVINSRQADAMHDDQKISIIGGKRVDKFSGYDRLEDAVAAARQLSVGDAPAVGIWADYGRYRLNLVTTGRYDDAVPLRFENGWSHLLPGMADADDPTNWKQVRSTAVNTGRKSSPLISLVDGGRQVAIGENPLAAVEAAEEDWWNKHGRPT